MFSRKLCNECSIWLHYVFGLRKTDLYQVSLVDILQQRVNLGRWRNGCNKHRWSLNGNCKKIKERKRWGKIFERESKVSSLCTGQGVRVKKQGEGQDSRGRDEDIIVETKCGGEGRGWNQEHRKD